MDFNDDFDEMSGGFYGRRIFSWSTALALQALSASKLQSLPEPAPLYVGSRVGPAVLGFCVLIVGAMLFLAFQGQFNFLTESILIIVLLAVLLAYGSIKEKTFKELFLAAKPAQGDSEEG
jgi:hypothetical protein